MGSWGYKTFEDDTTCDWLYDLYEAEDPHSFLLSSLNPGQSDGFLDDLDCSKVLGAAETVFSLLFQVRDNPPEEFKEWIQKNQDLPVNDLKSNCIHSLKRVLSEDSELNNIWSDSGEDYRNWKNNIQMMIDAFDPNPLL
ncbi:DUF4259 domain-containing protein [Gimesia aquarii]|uniref:DUF4259 domain-containing protein n=1 Tax=Gimesia aquarii TaxID=2527964 RepID=A0A517WSD6_9PLAN|nr:DUF4259 domain-containing protein [Gimesia aquarii]QDU08163.1 hypothetical protein V202x_15270 [Gimesia aquarii]QDU08169.1 hypothetical protein V202x_15330 [Gimesia aquarii]